MTYPEARTRLAEIAQELQRGVDLDTALKLWDEAQEVKAVCAEFILGAERKLVDAGVVNA